MHDFVWLDFSQLHSITPESLELHLGKREITWSPQLILHVHGFPKETNALPAYLNKGRSTSHIVLSIACWEKQNLWVLTNKKTLSNSCLAFQKNVFEIFKSSMTYSKKSDGPIHHVSSTLDPTSAAIIMWSTNSLLKILVYISKAQRSRTNVKFKNYSQSWENFLF